MSNNKSKNKSKNKYISQKLNIEEDRIRKQFSNFKKNCILYNFPNILVYEDDWVSNIEEEKHIENWIEEYEKHLYDMFLLFIDRLKDIKPEYKETQNDFFLFCDFIYEFS